MANKSVRGPTRISSGLYALGRYTYAFWAMGRPLFLLGAAPLYLLGVAAARRDSYAIHAWLLAAGLIVIWLVQLATHYNNEYRDLQTDLITSVSTRISGGSRVLVRAVVKPEAARVASVVAFSLALVLTIVSVFVLSAGYAMPALVGVGLLLGWYYSTPPLKLASRGAGELAIVIATGLLVPSLGYYLQASTLSSKVLLISMPLWPLILALRLATELPDLQADRTTGKITLVARLGVRRAIWLHDIMLSLGWLALGAEAAFASPLTSAVTAAIGAPLLAASLLTSRRSIQGRVPSMERMGLIDGFLIGCVTVSLSACLVLG